MKQYEILGGAIGAAIQVVGQIIIALIRLIRTKDVITKEQARALQQWDWSGKIKQFLPPDDKSSATMEKIGAYTMQVSLKVKARRIVKGEGSIVRDKNGKKRKFDLMMQGTFRNGVTLYLEYYNKNRSSIQFGNIVLKLDFPAEHLKGTFAGWGPEAMEPVLGTVDLTRIDESHHDGHDDGEKPIGPVDGHADTQTLEPSIPGDLKVPSRNSKDKAIDSV